MKTDEELKNTDFCPSCGNETKYITNFYFHKCETCGTTSYMGNLIHKSDLDYMVEVMKKEFYEEFLNHSRFEKLDKILNETL